MAKRKAQSNYKNKRALEDLKKELHFTAKQAEQYLEGWQRERARFENFQKDLERQKQLIRKAIMQEVAEQVLPVLDNFEQAQKFLDKDKQKDEWISGILQVRAQLAGALEKLGLQKIEVRPGDRFDPAVHEAMGGQGEYVDKLMQAGYFFEGGLIRPAKVTLRKANN